MNKPGRVFRIGRTLFLQQSLMRDGRVVGFTWGYAPPGVYVSQNPQSRFPRLIVSQPQKEFPMSETPNDVTIPALPNLLDGQGGFAVVAIAKRTDATAKRYGVKIYYEWGDTSEEVELGILAKQMEQLQYFFSMARTPAEQRPPLPPVEPSMTP